MNVAVAGVHAVNTKHFSWEQFVILQSIKKEISYAGTKLYNNLHFKNKGLSTTSNSVKQHREFHLTHIFWSVDKSILLRYDWL